MASTSKGYISEGLKNLEARVITLEDERKGMVPVIVLVVEGSIAYMAGQAGKGLEEASVFDSVVGLGPAPRRSRGRRFAIAPHDEARRLCHAHAHLVRGDSRVLYECVPRAEEEVVCFVSLCCSCNRVEIIAAGDGGRSRRCSIVTRSRLCY